MVADVQDQKGECDDHHDSPEIYELCAENGGISVRQNDKVVSFDVAKGE
jgi:hypothetical protein